jgi:hypothetical protein
MAEYPDAKHQLCFWHALCALKKWLGILRRALAHYNVGLIYSEFGWIDLTFVPLSQAQKLTPVQEFMNH